MSKIHRSEPTPRVGGNADIVVDQQTRHHLDKHAHVLAETLGDDDDLLDTPATAVVLNTCESWLIKGRSQGFGPPFVRLAPKMVRYRRSRLKQWLLEREFTSTSQYPARTRRVKAGG